jgi:hypothetical protein
MSEEGTKENKRYEESEEANVNPSEALSKK